MDIGQIAQIHHRHIHADSPQNGGRTVFCYHAGPVGQAAEQSVRVADGEYPHPLFFLRAERAAIADRRSRIKNFDGRDAGLEGHHGTHSHGARLLSRAVKGDAGADHIQIRFRVTFQRAAVGAVAQGETPPPFFQRVQNGGEQAELFRRIGPIGRLRAVGAGKMRENSFRLQTGQAAGPVNGLHAGEEMLPADQKPQAGHASIHFDMYPQGSS